MLRKYLGNLRSGIFFRRLLTFNIIMIYLNVYQENDGYRRNFRPILELKGSCLWRALFSLEFLLSSCTA
jgi:hypothetical protein